MKQLIFAILIFTTAGCTTLQANRLERYIDDVSKFTNAICAAAPLFELVDVPHPEKTHCDMAIRALNSDEYKTLVQTYKCTQRGSDDEIARCILAETDWHKLAKKIAE